ncbi:HTH_Tnp_Tc3_2 domain-containing protein [Trichonephila clavipes]|nr:HTH_Tnp_Tc3_2 domain-containing protein [Trichonephila clavipes]
MRSTSAFCCVPVTVTKNVYSGAIRPGISLAGEELFLGISPASNLVSITNETVSREFERSRIIGLREGGWANRRIAGHTGRSDAALRRCWQEWVDSGRFQRHDGSGRPTNTADQEDRLVVRSAVTAPDS